MADLGNVTTDEKLIIGIGVFAVGGGAILAIGAEIAARLAGAPAKHFSLLLGFQALGHLHAEAAIWHHNAPAGSFVVVCDVVVAIAVAALAVTGVKLFRKAELGAGASPTTLRSRKRDAQGLGCDADESPGILLGDSDYGRYDEPMFVLGQPGSGKSVWLTRNLLHTPGPSIVTSTKPEMFILTAGWHITHDRPVWVFDLSGKVPLDADLRLRWDPLASIRTQRDARIMGRRFAYASGIGKSEDQHWLEAGTGLLEALFWAAALARREQGPGEYVTMATVREWALTPGRVKDAINVLKRFGFESTAEMLTRDLAPENKAAGGGYTASVLGIVSTALAGFSEPALLDACSPAPGEHFDFERFIDERGVLYVVGSPEAQRSGAGVVAAMIEDTLEKAREYRMPQRPPLLLWLDEAPNLAVLPSLPEIVTTGRGEGICPVIIGQTLAKFADAFGPNGADTIREACVVELAYGGQKDIEYLRSLEAISGEATVTTWSESTGPDGGRSRTKAERVRPRFTVEEIRALSPHSAWLVDRHREMRAVKTTPWWLVDDGERVACSVAFAVEHGFARPHEVPNMAKHTRKYKDLLERHAYAPWRVDSEAKKEDIDAELW
ncbi:MAG: type IV secretory system conjugative DNA transfer family protein [Acidimicrobiales bacterium]